MTVRKGVRQTLVNKKKALVVTMSCITEIEHNGKGLLPSYLYDTIPLEHSHKCIVEQAMQSINNMLSILIK